MRNLLALFALALLASPAAAGPGIGISKDATLKGTGASTSPLGVDPTVVQLRVSNSCTVGSAIRAIASDGTVTCQSANSYTAGLGILISSFTISIDDTYTQRRVSSACAAGSSIRAIAGDGTVTCEVDDGSVTNVSTLAPLQGGPITTTGTVSLINCAANQIYKMNVGGTAWACATDSVGTVTSVSGGTGVTVTNPTTTPNVALDNTVWQSRVSGTCTGPNSITSIAAGGTVSCTTGVLDTTAVSGTSGRSTRFTGANVVGNGAFTDDGTNATAQGNITSIVGVNTIGHERGSVTTPSALGVTVNDYSGCDSNTRVCQLSASTTGVAITGLTGGAAGRALTLVNVGTNDITLSNETASTASNQLKNPGALGWVLKAGCEADERYDNAASRWRIEAWGCANLPGLTIDGNLVFGSGVSSTHVMNGFLDAEKNFAAASLNIDGNMRFRDLTAFSTGNGGAVSFAAKYNTAGTVIDGAAIRAWKTNSTDGDSSYDLVFGTNTNGVAGGPQEWLRITDQGHLDTKGTAPTLSTCGTSPSVVGNDKAGTVTIGTGGTATACTITFAGAFVTNAPACELTSQMSTRVDLYVSAESTTAFTVSNAAGVAWPASGKFNYFCPGLR